MHSIRQHLRGTLQTACLKHQHSPVGSLLRQCEHLLDTHHDGYKIAIGLFTPDLLASIEGHDRITTTYQHLSVVRVLRKLFAIVDKLYIERAKRLSPRPHTSTRNTQRRHRQPTILSWTSRADDGDAPPPPDTRELRGCVHPADSRRWDK